MIFEKSKIVIVDDTFEDVEKLLLFFKKRGIGYLYYSDDHKEYPKTPLKGVKLVFLDFVMNAQVTDDSNSGKISHLMQILKTIISSDNCPFILVAWTKHPNLISSLGSRILQDKDCPKPVAIIDLDKIECMRNIRKIGKNIEDKLKDSNSLFLLFLWESIINDSVNDTLGKLSNISKPITASGMSYVDFSNSWNEELKTYFYKFTKSLVGSNIQEESLVSDLFTSLTPYFNDCLEQKTSIKSYIEYQKLSKEILEKKDSNFDSKKIAGLHSKFLVNEHIIDQKIQPGNVYDSKELFKLIKCKNSKCSINEVLIDTSAIIKEFHNINSHKGNKQLYAEDKKNLKRVKPILLEITPECDYVQNNWKHSNCAKFILGVLSPIECEKLIKSSRDDAGKIYPLFPIMFGKRHYNILFHSQFLFVIPLNKFKKIKPKFRLRKEFSVDVMHWYSKQISRPGKTDFR